MTQNRQLRHPEAGGEDGPASPARRQERFFGWTIRAIAASLLAAALPALAQVAPTSTPAPLTGVSVGVEVRRDRFDYRFENPSSFDTPDLVPHFFEQTYDADNVWLTARAGYRIGRSLLETELGGSLSSQGRGSDHDTFFQPGGDVVVYGTTAVTEIQSWRAAQFVGLGEWHSVGFRVGYAYRHDRSVFLPSPTTITHTVPPSSSSFWNTDRESTVSETHQLLLGAARVFGASAWRARLSADVAPATIGRLTTVLPDKYDQPVVFSAKAVTLNARLEVSRSVGRWTLGGRLDTSHAWSYSQADRFHWDGAGAQLVVGFGPPRR